MSLAQRRESATEDYKKLSAELLEQGAEDTLLACAVARWHTMFFGRVDSLQIHREDKAGSTFCALHKVIQFLDRQRHQEATQSDEPIDEIAAFVEEYAHHIFEHRWRLEHKESQDGKGLNLQDFAHEITRAKSQIMTVLKHKQCHSTNVRHVERAKVLVRDLVRLDRLPMSEDLESLLLLRDAWDEYDTKSRLAKYNKRLSKIMYGLLIILSIVIVSCTVWQSHAEAAQLRCQGNPPDCQTFAAQIDVDSLGTVVFVLSLLSAFLVAISSFVNPVQRWRRLRSSCNLLQSTIYQYRAHVGDFALSSKQPDAARVAFRDFLAQWRKDISGGTDLSMTPMEQAYPSHVFQHFQYSGGDEVDGDDFNSPLRPNEYIRFRLLAMRRLYQERLPRYARYRSWLQMGVFVCTSLSALLAHLKRASVVAIVTSMAAGITSWVEFTEYGQKMERYTVAVQSLKNLQTWWQSLCEVEKSCVENVTRLVQDCEGIIDNEFRAWGSTTLRRTGDETIAEGSAAGEGTPSANKMPSV